MKSINNTEVNALAALYLDLAMGDYISVVIARFGCVRASNTVLSRRKPYSLSETLHKCRRVIAQTRAMNVQTLLYVRDTTKCL